MYSTLFATILTASVAGLATDTPAGPTTTVDTWVVCTDEIADAACDHLRRAEALLVEHRRKEARWELEAALRTRRENRQYAGVELWELANFHVHSGRHSQTVVRLLDELTAEAARYGDLSRQASALIEATIIYTDLGRGPEAASRLAQLMPLLDSPYLPEATRQKIRSRLL
jgi:hypothetical protein